MMTKTSISLALVSIAFAFTAFATAPNADSNLIQAETAPVVDVLAPAAGGVYDTEALWCIEAAEAAPQETRCWKCSDSSKGDCAGGDKYCYGERSDCSKKGCKITGSTSKCDGAKKKNQC